jgi:hypothetical protein
MSLGKPVSRHWIVVLENGNAVIDWGDGLFQDIMSGDFVQVNDEDISHPILDDELETLKRAGRVETYDSQNVYIFSMPEPPRRTID